MFNKKLMMAVVAVLLLIEQASAWCNTYYGEGCGYGYGYGYHYGYHYGYSNTITYTGMAMGYKDGEMKLIPVSECEFGCAYNGVCGTETECAIGSVVVIIVCVVFGVIFLAVGVVICCVCCAAATKAIKEARDSDSSYSSH